MKFRLIKSTLLKGFTLIELLVVIAIISFLLAELVPALNSAKVKNATTVCLANLNSLSKAWLLYTENNDDNIVGSGTVGWDAWQTMGYPAWNPTTTIRKKNFVAFPQDENHSFRNISLEDEIRGLQQGGLWPYVESEKIYHCPLDTRYLSAAFAVYDYDAKGGYRTYSMGCPMNGYDITSGWMTGEYYACVYKTVEIRNPGRKIVFLEEQDAGGYNTNTWNIYLNEARRWPGDPIACIHNKRSVFGYTDGHAEIRQWQNKTTVFIFENSIKNTWSYPYKPDEGEDLGWFVHRYLPGEIRPELKAMLPDYK
ncbi:MAG: type II secretion system protein [Sedimentisphaerales bacterium]|nr:type II secretion system protein [Sedimentisphaerales bacterium]